MRLSAVVGQDMTIPPEWDRDVQHIRIDSRDVATGDLFIARKGSAGHGADYISQAIAQGAVAILEEGGDVFRCEFPQGSAPVPVFGIESLGQHLSGWLATRYHRVRDSQLFAVTGTNGKSSVTQFIAQLAARCEAACGVVGTLGNGVWPALEATRNTTPDITVTYRLLDTFIDAGAAMAALEVSSHGLDQGRVDGLHFDTAVLTNLTQDHLDYHGDMDSYYGAKARLFTEGRAQAALINIDDEYGRRLVNEAGLPETVLTFGVSDDADICVQDAALNSVGQRAWLTTPWGEGELIIPMLAPFNLVNMAAAIGVLAQQGFNLNDLLAHAQHVMPVAGRMALYTRENSAKAVIDFAHTPDALANVVAALRTENIPLTCVFGCGGERDRAKRPLMAEAAAQADQVWVTDDNPRSESPEQITNDICQFSGAVDFRFERDRQAAITAAIEATSANGIVLVAGKGHENTQEIAGVKHSYSDEAVLLSLGYQAAGGQRD